MIVITEIKEYLEEQQTLTGAAYGLFDEEGRCVYSTDTIVIKESQVQTFALGDKQEKLQKDKHFAKIVLAGETAVLVTVLQENATMFGRLARLAIAHIQKAKDPDSTLEGVVTRLLLEDVSDELLRKSTEKGLKAEGVRTVFLMRFADAVPEEAGEILKNISPDAEKDLAIMLDQKTLAYIRSGRGAREEKELSKFAEEAYAMLSMELFADTRISYGMSVNHLKELRESYKAAYMAMEVAKIFYEQRRVVSYGRLGIGRLIYELPVDLCNLFLKEIFGENRLCNLDEEEQSLIERFFANNLNISETARDLFMHRNTLTFRLEKLQKHTGLDIRKFEDAMTLKLGMLVARFLQCHSEKSDQ